MLSENRTDILKALSVKDPGRERRESQFQIDFVQLCMRVNK